MDYSAKNGLTWFGRYRDFAEAQAIAGPRNQGRGLKLTEEPLVSIGAIAGDPNYQLQDVRGATRLPDGNIVVADPVSQTVRWYDPTGVHLKTAGRGGRGVASLKGVRGLCGVRSG